MSAREDILTAIRKNKPAGDFPLPEVKVHHLEQGDDRTEFFVKSLKGMGGKVLEIGDGSVADAMAATFSDAEVIASATAEVNGNRDLTHVAQQSDLHDVDVAVVRATAGVAETGSVLFVGSDLIVNAVAYLAQHLIVLLDPADIVPGLEDAYLLPAFHENPYAVFHSGPSATADIEGVLIHGAQGVRTLHVALVPREK